MNSFTNNNSSSVISAHFEKTNQLLERLIERNEGKEQAEPIVKTFLVTSEVTAEQEIDRKNDATMTW